MRYRLIAVKPKLLMALLLVMTLLISSGCGKPANQPLAVAEQYGLAYAPIQVMKEKGFLEAALAKRTQTGQSVSVKWVKLANTTSIREAMLADTLDVAFVGIPPFLIGVDQGMPWKMITGLSECPLDLMANARVPSNLASLAGSGKIALPQPGSIQHILLAMAAEKQLGSATIFDRQLVSMKHPDGMQALLAGQDIVAHFTAPPYNFMETETAGVRSILTGEEAMGEPFSFIVGIAEPLFYEDKVRLGAFIEALQQSFAFIDEHRDETVALLAASFELSPELTENYLYERGITFGKQIRGIETFSAFMTRAGYTGRQYHAEEVVWK